MPVLQVQIADEGAHQARLTHPGCQGEAQGRECPLKIRDRRIFDPDNPKCLVHPHAMPGMRDLHHAVQTLQRLALRRA